MTEKYDPFAPQEQVFMNFGEIAYYGYFDGTWEGGAQNPVPYEPTIHNWHKLYHSFVAIPFGRKEPDFNQYLTVDSKEWHLFYGSLNDVLNGTASKFLGEHVDKSFFAQWVKEPVRQYKSKKDDQMKDVYGYKIVALFAGMEECEMAYNQFKASEPLPEGSKVEAKKVDALPLEQALGFVETLARQAVGSDSKVDRDKLAASFKAMPMLATLSVDMPEVEEKIKLVEKVELLF